MTPEQQAALKAQADAQRAAAAQATDEANQQGLKGAAKLEKIAAAIEKAAQEASKK